MTVGLSSRRLSGRPSTKLHSVRPPEEPSGAGPSDATIVPSGLNETKLIQPDLSAGQPMPISFSNLSECLSLCAQPGAIQRTKVRARIGILNTIKFYTRDWQ